MIDDADGSDAQLAPTLLTELRLAIAFLTILPVIDERRASEETVAKSFAWFPLVGFAIGAFLCVEDWLLAPFFAQVLRSILIVLSLTIVTGAVHLDGLADTADALGAGRDRTRALDILRDSRIGTFGAIAIFFDLTLKILALSTLAGHLRSIALVVAPMLSRLAMVWLADGMTYLRDDGAGSELLRRKSLGLRTPTVTLIIVVVVLALGDYHAVGIAAAVAIAIVFAMRFFYRRWLGGVTGDLIGACAELVEIAVLISLS